MRRYGRTIAFIAVLVTLATLILAFQKITIGNFERGSNDTWGWTCRAEATWSIRRP